MFSQKLVDILEQAERIGKFPPSDEQEILPLLEKSISNNGLEIGEIVDLVNGTFKEENQELVKDFASCYKRPHEQDILLLPPLYFSSICENDCLYCNFSSKGNRLSHSEFLDEFNMLLDLGYKSIELVSSQDPDIYVHGQSYDPNTQVFQIDEVIPYFDMAKKRLDENGGGMLTSNIPPVDRESFSKLKSAGLDCYLSWLETFNPAQYKRLHNENGPKVNQKFRLDAFENALLAEIEHVAGAFLKGLYDWRQEEVVLYQLDRYLKENQGRGFSIIGTPRLKGSFVKSSLVKDYLVLDKDYELNIALDRILFEGILWLQTRESIQTNRSLISKYGGGVILTLTSSTAPGGYYRPAKTREQFPVFKQNLDQSVKDFERLGFNMIFNWNSKDLSDFQRKKDT
jgi:2-iminoacetate synthase